MKAINNIKHVNVNPVVTDSKILEDKAVVEGVVNCCVMYSPISEEGGVESYTEEIPFKSVVDMPGSKIDMNSEVNANVEHVSYEKTSPREVDLKVIVECNTKVFSRSTVDIVKAVEEMDISENIKNMPSLTVYTVQQNDTLWKIAKRYSTTIEDIAKINEIQDPDSIDVGAKLLIPKKNFMRFSCQNKNVSHSILENYKLRIPFPK
jgi:LysM repeat protein